MPVRLLVGISGALALIVLGSSGSALAATSPASSGSQPYVVVLKGTVTPAQVLQDAQADGATPQRTYSYALSGYSADLSTDARNRATADPNVAMVVPDQAMELTSLHRGGPPRRGGAVGNNHQPAGLPVIDYSQFIPTALERIFLQKFLARWRQRRRP